jgi:thiosulfate/3-mercaptopyruvate sulfurtransferase
MTNPLITVDELLAYDGPLGVADVRWYLDEPTHGHHAYHAGHIPGAVFVNLDVHLSESTGPGRHPLPTREALAAAMEGCGFDQEQLIVAYDDRGGAIAARLWWMLRDIGHDGVRVLDGGITAWQAAGQAVESKLPTRHPATMPVRPSATRQIDRDELSSRLGTVTLLDSREPERYRGEEEPIDPIAGHIPTALSASMMDNLAEDETLLDTEQLRKRFTGLGVDADRDTVVYCGSGVTACHNALAIVLAGLPEPILYPGSWSDWSATGGAVALGEEAGEV